jgi:hypothetical protein
MNVGQRAKLVLMMLIDLLLVAMLDPTAAGPCAMPLAMPL